MRTPATVDTHTLPDGLGLPVQRLGRGPVLWQMPHWVGSLAHDGDNPVVAPVLQALGTRHTVLRHELRGCGRAVVGPDQPLGFDAWLADMEHLADRVAPPRFALLGQSQGAALAIAYAARHPDRVSRLVLHGGYARGRRVRDPLAAIEMQTMERLAALGWDRAEASARQLFTTQILPDARRAEQAGFNDAQRLSAGGAQVARLLHAMESIDVSAWLPQVRCPTLVLHSRDDRRVPFTQGLELAAGIAGAEFVPLDSANHLLVDSEPAWPRWLEAVREFLPPDAAWLGAPDAAAPKLTPRQRELAELVAQGQGNGQIAHTLGLSSKTVRNHMSRLFEALAVENRGQAIVATRERGFGRGSPASVAQRGA